MKIDVVSQTFIATKINLFTFIISVYNYFKTKEYNDKKLTTEEAMVAIVSHEGEHDLNKVDIKAIKERQDGKINLRDVEDAATNVEYIVAKEIKEKRKN